MWKLVAVVLNIISFSFSKILNKVSLENLLDIVCWKLYDHRDRT